MSVRSDTRIRAVTGVIGRLNLEWARLCDDPGANAAAVRWAAHDEPLKGLETLKQIEQATDVPVDESIDGIFYALVVRAVNGEQLSGRVVLQLMLGKVVRIADKYAVGGERREEYRQLAVACLWEAITTFPIGRRTHHIPAHLAWDTHRAVRTAVRQEQAELPMLGIEQAPAPPPDVHASEELLQVLINGVRDRRITAEDAGLMLTRYSGGSAEDSGRGSWKGYGTPTGKSPAAVRQQCRRIVRRLSEGCHDPAA